MNILNPSFPDPGNVGVVPPINNYLLGGYVGYSGTMTSPFFLHPTAAQGMRKIDVGLNFNF